MYAKSDAVVAQTPWFPTIDERDRRVARYVDQGGSMVNGMTCQVGGVWFKYQNGSWIRERS